MVNSRAAHPASGSSLTSCEIVPDIMLKGQIEVHYHGMALKLDGCPPRAPVEQRLRFSNAGERNKILAVLPYPRNEDYFVDIEFFASETAFISETELGEILIERIVTARQTEDDQFDKYYR